MKIERTEWPKEEYGPAPPDETNTLGADRSIERQPGFGVEIMWNVPRQWWKPCLLVQMWKTRVSIGWLYE